MKLPLLLQSALSDFSNAENQKRLFFDAQMLSRRYRDEKEKTTTRLMTTKDDALAYALSRMPATFGAISLALHHTLNAFPDNEKIETFVDVGAGTGSACWAICDALDIQKGTCLEREKNVLNLGKDLMGKAPFSKKVFWELFDVTKNKIPQADLIVCSYVLNELSDTERLNALENLWNATKKILLIIDPATKNACKKNMENRLFFIDKSAFILAPCPHEKECPLSFDGWCHFSCRIERSKSHKALKAGSAPFEDEKFSYLAICKQPPLQRKPRVLRHPVTRTGCVDMSLCLPDGICVQKTFSRRDKSLFKTARKTNWGDLMDLNG